MNDIIFEVIKIVVMVAVLVITRYLVPWIREKIGADKMMEIEKWVRFAVLKAQQVMQSATGEDKKAYVTEFLKQLLSAKNIALSDEQLEVLIEAAVKQMKIEENAGITIEATDAMQSDITGTVE